MALTVQDILHATYAEFERTHAVAGYVRQAMWWLLRCGTAALGGYRRRCPDGHMSIVIGHPVYYDGEWELGHVLEKFGCFQLEMANRGFFVRGGLSVGDLYMDDNIVFGPALIDAYVAERDQARDPRIVLTDSAVAAVKKHIGYYASPEYAPQTSELFVDSDGQYFISYLNAVLIAEDDHGPYFEEVLKHKRRTEYCLKQYRNRPAIWSKYRWAAGYHNFFSRLHDFEQKYTINLTKFEITPSLIR